MKYTISFLVGFSLLVFNMVFWGFPENETKFDLITEVLAVVLIFFGSIGEFIRTAARELRPHVTVENIHKHEVREEKSPSLIDMLEDAMEKTQVVVGIIEANGCIANEDVPVEFKSHYEEEHCEEHRSRECAPEPKVEKPLKPSKSKAQVKAIKKTASRASKSPKKQ
jgi:hypothetical protein